MILLRFALKLDGVASGGMGLLTLAFRPAIGFPSSFLYGVGAFLVAYGVFVFWLGTRPVADRRLVLLVIVGNLLWVADSMVALGWFALTGVGVALVLAQAVAVLGFVVLQAMGLRAVSGSGHGTPQRPRHPAAP